MKIAVCIIVKNEEPNILEWICFHLAAGFDTVLVYDNHSTDRTLEIAKSAALVGDVRTMLWESTPRQTGCYAHAAENNKDEFDWIAFIDSDEFLFSPKYRDIKDLLGLYPQSEAIAVHWACYGSSGATEISDRLVIEEFTNRGPLNLSANRHIKSIVRPEHAVRPMSGHRFEMANEPTPITADGKPVTSWRKETGKTSNVNIASFDFARINHYYTRSKAHYARKLQRGDLVANKKLEDAFNHFDRNDEHDPAAMVYFDKVSEMISVVNKAKSDRPTPVG